MDTSSPWNPIQLMPAQAARSARVKGTRRYQRGLSKQMMKLKRYKLNGNTQRKGTAATSWHILLVVANRSTDAQAGSNSHNIFCAAVGRATSVPPAVPAATGAFAIELRQSFSAQNPEATT